MKETPSQAIEQWERAAQREAREGNAGAAVTFRNMGWLVAHPEGWREFIESESKAAH
jgi:hypothetical protein